MLKLLLLLLLLKKIVELKLNKKKKHGGKDNYAVHDMELLNKLIEAKFIEHLHGIHINFDKSKSWHFDKVDGVKSIIDAYFKTEEK